MYDIDFNRQHGYIKSNLKNAVKATNAVNRRRDSRNYNIMSVIFFFLIFLPRRIASCLRRDFETLSYYANNKKLSFG